MEQNETDFTEPTDSEEPLSDRQLLALPFIAAASPSITQGAKAAGIARSTLIRWRRDPHFRAELERMRSEAASLAYTELQGLVLKSVNSLAELLEHQNPSVRLSAIRSVLSSAFRANDLNQLYNRFDVIDNSISLLKNETIRKPR